MLLNLTIYWYKHGSKKEAKNDFEKFLLNWWITMDNVRKHNLVATENISN